LPAVNSHRSALPYGVMNSLDVTSIAASPRANGSSGPLLLWLLASLLTGGCVGSGIGLPDAASSTAVPDTFENIQTLIFDPLCAAPCHNGGAPPKGLSLEAGRSLSGLVGVPSTEAPGMLRVAPGKPEESYLIVKLVKTDSRRFGARMPRTGPPYLEDPQIRALERWIRAGATDDWVDGDGSIDAGISDAAPPYDAVPIPDSGAPDAPAVRGVNE